MKLRFPLLKGSVPRLALLSLFGVAVLIPLVGWRWLGQSAAVPQKETVSLSAQPVKVAALGRIEPVSKVVKVGGPVNEVLESLLVKEGDWVQKGQILGYLRTYKERKADLAFAQEQLELVRARLGAETLYGRAQVQERAVDVEKLPSVQTRGIEAQQAAIASLQAELSLAETELSRFQFLVAQGASARTELDQRQSKANQLRQQVRRAEETLQQLISTRDRELASARAQLQTAETGVERVRMSSEVIAEEKKVELAQVRMENTLIRAPQTGRILRVMTVAGESIGDEGQGKGSIVILGNTNAMQVIAEVHESDIRLIKPRQAVKITSRNQAFAGTLNGQVSELGYQIFKNNLLNDDPSALRDARVIEVKVRLQDSQAVASFTNLQVDVEIIL